MISQISYADINVTNIEYKTTVLTNDGSEFYRFGKYALPISVIESLAEGFKPITFSTPNPDGSVTQDIVFIAYNEDQLRDKIARYNDPLYNKKPDFIVDVDENENSNCGCNNGSKYILPE